MADLVAIVSIISGATVAIAVPFINARLERSRLRWQSETARLDELRALLDAAILHGYEAWTVVYEWVWLEGRKDPQSADWSPKRFHALATSMTAKFDEVQRDQLRISVRLPAGAALTERHDRMTDVLRTCESQYTAYVESGGPERRASPPTELPRPSMTPMSAPAPLAIDEVQAALGEFLDEVRSFIDAAPEERRT